MCPNRRPDSGFLTGSRRCFRADLRRPAHYRTDSPCVQACPVRPGGPTTYFARPSETVQAGAFAFDPDILPRGFRSCPATGLNNPKKDNSILEQMANSGKMNKAAAGRSHKVTIT